MTPKIKAEEIFNNFYELPINYDTAKECAKIHVRGIIQVLSINYTSKDIKEFWNDVLKEIDNL